MKEPKLEQIFWKDGKFVDKNNISVKIIPIGISRIFASMAANVIISKRGLEKNIDLETFEKNEIKKYLMEHEDKNYQKVNAYTKSVALEKENYYYISVNFYEKL